MDKKYLVLPNNTSTFKPGTYKYLVVSKTNDKDLVEIIFGDRNTKHAAMLQAYMNDNNIRTVFVWGGGSMTMWCDGRWYICFYGTSGDFDSTTEELLEIVHWKNMDTIHCIYDPRAFSSKEERQAKEYALRSVDAMLR